MKNNNIKKAFIYSFNISIFIIVILYVATFLGIFYINPNYIDTFSVIIHIIIALVLIIRFNPFNINPHHFDHDIDPPIIFTSGIFILTNIGFTFIFENKTIQTLYSQIY
jgi:hypothetical protein